MLILTRSSRTIPLSSMPAVILAFGFGSPLMLWGLGLGALPILIHLLHRRKYREVPWAAMRFLIAATKKHSRRMHLEQLLLLMLRTLIVLLVALALARPTVETFGEYFRAEGPRHRILVIDSTFSMGYASQEQSRFDRAKELARQIALTARQGDALQLVRIADSSPRTVIRQPAYQASAVLDEIAQLTLLDERVDASLVLDEIDALLGMAPEITRKEIYVLTDLQTATWAPRDATEATRIRTTLKRLAERARIVFLDTGQPGTANAAVTSLQASEGFVLAGRPVTLSATLRNSGSSGAVGQLVELLLDDRLADTRQVDLPPATDVRVTFNPAFSAGDHRVEVRLKPDGLRVDDGRRLVIPVRDELQVLLVNGKPSGQPLGNATDYLKLALAPELPNQAPISPIRPTVIREGELISTDLSRFDSVFLCNVALLTDREAEVLRNYLEAGGGVVICLGDQVRPDNYNEVLFRTTGRNTTPILPARLVQRVGDPDRKDVSYEFDAGDFDHPIVRPFQGNPGAGLELTRTFAYFKTAVPDERGTRVALRFQTGDPAILEAPYGRGRVVLVTTSVDREWSTWAVWGHSLIPLMHETVNFAVSSRWSDRVALVGQPLLSHLPLRSGDVDANLQLPNGTAQAPLATADGRAIQTDPAMRAGFYKLILGPPVNRTDWFAVNVDPQESDLASLRPDELRTEILPGQDIVIQTDWEELPATPQDGPVRVVSTSSGLSRSLLLAALALLVVEQIMAWRFLPGVLVLIGLAAAALIGGTWTLSPISGGALLAVCAIVAAWLLFGQMGSRMPRS